MSPLFPSPQSKVLNRRLITGTLAVLVVTLVVIVEMVPSALAFTFSQFPTLTGQADPTVITLGPDGNLWFTETLASKIGKITPAGTVTEFSLPTQGSLPSGITAGPDGALWFTEPGNAKIGRITPSGTITEFPIPSLKTELFEDIARGPDGALWFVDRPNNSLAQITTEGVVKEFSIPTQGANPFGITAGTDGGVWFTEISSNQIGRFDPSRPSFLEFPIPTQASNPGFIAAGPDGALWFTEFNANQIGRITTTGSITELPVLTKGSGPNGITSGPDGAIWFTEFNAGQIGQLVLTPGPALELSPEIAPAAIIHEFPIIPGANPGPKAITTGADRNLWFTESTSSFAAQGGTSAIGRLVPDVQQVNADLSISIAAPSQAASGTQMAYTITINNAGPGTATGVTVNAPTPAGTTFSSVSATGAKVTPPAPGTTGTITAAFGSLAPGGVGRFLVTVNVLAASGTSLSATATVTGTSTDPNTANNTATQIIPVQGGGIVFLSWTRPVPTAANPIPPPGNLTASAGIPQPNTELLTAESVVEPSDTVSCPGGFIVGYNIYIASTASVAIVPANLWVAMVPPDQLNAKVASRPGGTFYAMTTLWNCGGMIVESGSSNTASTCQGPEIRQVKVSGKIKIFGSSFTDPATGPVSSVFVDGFPYNKAPIFLDSTFLKQKGTIDVNGTQMNVLDYMVGKTSIVITVQVQSTQGSQQNTCISSISFPPGP